MQKMAILAMFVGISLLMSGSVMYSYSAKPHDYWDLPPKKQTDAGIAPHEVVCKEGMQLML